MLPWYKKEDMMTKVYFVESSCCSPELINMFSSRYDPERLYIVRAESMDEADILVISGYVSVKMLERLRNIYAGTKYKPEIIASGGCAINGGPLNAPDLELPVSMYVPGCPPRPEAMLDAIIKLKKAPAHGKKGLL